MNLYYFNSYQHQKAVDHLLTYYSKHLFVHMLAIILTKILIDGHYSTVQEWKSTCN